MKGGAGHGLRGNGGFFRPTLLSFSCWIHHHSSLTKRKANTTNLIAVKKDEQRELGTSQKFKHDQERSERQREREREREGGGVEKARDDG